MQQRYKSRIALRRDIVKDDSGAYAVLTEQVLSFPHVTAATVMDVIASFLDCARQAVDAVSAYTQEKCEGVGDVVGVVTPVRGVAQVGLHGVKVVEVVVVLRVHQDRGVEEDGEEQVEVEREESEVRENRT